MTKYLAYASPARGHLYPLVPTLCELAARGHDVHVRCLSSEVDALNSVGLHAAPLAPAIESAGLTDWQATSMEEGIAKIMETFAARAVHEVPDLQAAIDEIAPDVLLVDTTTIGAHTLAELGDRPWVQWLPFFYGPLPFSLEPSMDALDAIRAGVGAPPLDDHLHFWNRANAVLYFTAAPLAPPEPPLPANFHMVGSGSWNPPADAPAWLADLDEPIALVTVSSEYQNDAFLIGATLEALADEDLRVVVSTVAHDPRDFKVPANAIVERFIPHQPVIDRASVVVCHGGMGIVQKALSSAVPLCVVPGGRDQFAVAERVATIGAGTTLLPFGLEVDDLRAAIRAAMTMTDGAKQAAEGFAATGGAPAAADVVEAVSAD